MKYDILMFDVDDTLLDFAGCEYPALADALEKNGIIITAQEYEAYKLINTELWKNYENGVYTKEEILTLRFDLFFVQLGVFGDAAQVSHDYLLAVGRHIKYEPKAETLLKAIKSLEETVTMVIITNGARIAQEGKLAGTGLGDYFEYIFISDDTGFHKPQIEYFDIVANGVKGFDKKRALIIGDSLRSDIQGGINYDIDTCWYNKLQAVTPKETQPTYEITNLMDVLKLL